MRYLLLAVLLLAGCANVGMDYDFHGAPFTVRVENHYGYGVNLYWVVEGVVRPATAARITAKSNDVVRVPDVLRHMSRIGVLVCVGNRTPQTPCSLAEGFVRPNEFVGNILVIHAFTRLAAAIT